jgi:hypothetical protein
VGRVTAILVLVSALPAAAQVGAPWRETPAHAALFAPAGDRAAFYRAYSAPMNLDTALSRLGHTAAIDPAGAWTPRSVAPADAFGQAGRYDRAALARLYGATQPRVARGARLEGGRVAESWTLISPYPDPSLSRLEPGTLLLVLRLP